VSYTKKDFEDDCKAFEKKFGAGVKYIIGGKKFKMLKCYYCGKKER